MRGSRSLTAGVGVLCCLGLTGCASSNRASDVRAAGAQRPNFIIILTDDQGYGDLGCFGSPDIRTPHLDRMAEQGMRFTSFYSQPVCGPARAALMTGSYPTRVMRGKWALPTTEITLAEVLKEAGYATGCVGKWDLSGRRYVEGLVPNDQGFGSYFGTLGANDRGQVSLMQDRTPQAETEDMGSLTGMYTERAIRFVQDNRSRPFFLYLAHTMPHVVMGASDRFRGRSARGLYGDVIEEIDANVGRLLDTVKECGLDDRTVVLFMSDNGPWLSKKEMGGSAGGLRNGKGSAWEGGFRVPCIMRAPGRIPAGTVYGQMVASIDILPTFAALAGARMPADRVIDGKDQSPLITGRAAQTARETFYYYVKDNLHAVRRGRWKLALPNRREFYPYARDHAAISEPQLYDLDRDPGEAADVAGDHPDVVRELLGVAAEARAEIGDLEQIGRTARSQPG